MASGLPAHVEEADLISYGLVGLIYAIERFDLEREIKFETYAITRIKGAIIDELRSLDWVPRSVRARAREIEKANSKLEHRLQRAPTDEEMSAELGITRRRVPGLAAADLHLDGRRARRAVDRLGRQRRPGVAARHAAGPGRARPGDVMDATELKDRVADAIARLPEREKLVVALYYYENLTLREIGEVLGVTESRISQLHTKAVLRLRSRLATETDALPGRRLRGHGGAAARARAGGPPRRRAARAPTGTVAGRVSSTRKSASKATASTNTRTAMPNCVRRETSAATTAPSTAARNRSP